MIRQVASTARSYREIYRWKSRAQLAPTGGYTGGNREHNSLLQGEEDG